MILEIGELYCKKNNIYIYKISTNNPYQLFTEIIETELNNNSEYNRKNMYCAVLSTIQSNNTPFSRSVYIIDTIDEKMTFITSILSSKCDDINNNNNVSLLFRWKNNQINICGKAYICSNDINTEYWNKRSLIHQQNSWKRYRSLHYIVSNKYNIPLPEVPYIPLPEVPYIPLPEVPSIPLPEVPSIPLTKVPHWGIVQIIPNSYDFTINIENYSKKRTHFAINSHGEWIKLNDKFTLILGNEIQ